LPESQRFLLLGMGVMVLFLIAGTYFIARAVRREMEVSRMQSDFVSAVSHEFRSPLTSIRQLSEILELGRVPSDERRQVYYTTLVRETQRCSGWEALLNSGAWRRARAYSFRDRDGEPGTAWRGIRSATGGGPRIELSGPMRRARSTPIRTRFRSVLRNLIDNA
jgi:signal transduction histidine kinase